MIYRKIKYLQRLLFNLFLISGFILFVFFAYFFYNLELKFPWGIIHNPYYGFITGLPIWVYFIICFTALSILFVFVFIALSLYYSYTRHRNTVLKFKYDKIFTVFLSKYFLSENFNTLELSKPYFKKIKPILKTRIQLLSFVDSYLKMQELLTLNLSDDFKRLIQELKLQKRIEMFLFHREFDDKIIAMKFLSYSRIYTFNNQIIKYANSENIALRTEAYVALIRLMQTGDDLTNFVGNKHSLSLLDANIIVNAVLKNNKMNIDYRALLTSKQTQKNLIGLILAKYRFRKNINNLTLIINYLDTKNIDLRKLAWDALLNLVPDDNAIDIIIQEYNNQPDEIKLNIIRNSKIIINQKYIEFLNSIIIQQSLLVKIEIMKIIYEHDFSNLSIYENSNDIDLRMAYNEISNVYLSM